MASLTERNRNNVRAGVFVSVVIILAMAVVFVLGDVKSYFGPRHHTYAVVFPFSAGVENIHGGAGVRVGGMPMGKVLEVKTIPDPQAAEDTSFVDHILIRFTLDQKVRLYHNALIRVEASLIGAESWLDIDDLGQGDPMKDGDTLTRAGSPPANLLDTAMGEDMEDMKEQARTIMNNVKNFSETLATVQEDYENEVRPVLKDVREMVALARDEHWQQWLNSIDQAMAWIEAAPDDLNELLDEGKAMMADARSVVTENREKIDHIIDDVEVTTANSREITGRINNETIDKIHRVLDNAGEGLDSALAIIDKAGMDYEGWSTDVQATLGGAMQASKQLELTMIEVRRNPWKLLYRPTTDELEHELLYDAARSFAYAAADLRAATTTANLILERSKGVEGETGELFDPEARSLLMERLKTTLIDPMDHYEKAQQKLFDIILADTPGSP